MLPARRPPCQAVRQGFRCGDEEVFCHERDEIHKKRSAGCGEMGGSVSAASSPFSVFRVVRGKKSRAEFGGPFLPRFDDALARAARAHLEDKERFFGQK